MMNDFQMCIFLVFPWKKDLGRPEAEMGTFLSQRSTDFFLKGALRAVWDLEEAHQLAAVAGANSSGDGGELLS